MLGRTGRCPQNDRSGFTLVELVLAVALLLLLLGAVAFNYSTLNRGVQLDEGGTQFEALFRFVQAEAASSGRMIEIRFAERTEDGGTIPFDSLQVRVEADPFGAPGVFSALPEAAPFVRSVQEMVQIRQVQTGETDPGANATATTDGEGKPASLTDVPDKSRASVAPSVRFYPDGSSETMSALLSSRDGEDRRRLRVHWTGVDGTLRRQFVARETTEAENQPEKAP